MRASGPSALALAGGCSLVACQAISGLGGFGVDDAPRTAATSSAALGSGGAGASASASKGAGGAPSTAIGSANGGSSASQSGGGAPSSSSSASSSGGGGACAYYVFVSVNDYASGSGVDTLDQACGLEAVNYKLQMQLPGNPKWKAILSTSQAAAKTRIKSDCDVFLANDGGIVPTSVLVASANQLWQGSLQHAIDHDPNGFVVPGFISEGGGPPMAKVAWTGSTNNGMAAANLHCSDWKQTSGNGQVSQPLEAGSKWAEAGSVGCGEAHKLYCISQP